MSDRRTAAVIAAELEAKADAKQERKGGRRKDLDDLRNFDRLPDLALVNKRTVMALVSVSETTLYRWVREGHFPGPLQIGGTSRWRVGSLRECLRGLQEGTRENYSERYLSDKPNAEIEVRDDKQ